LLVFIFAEKLTHNYSNMKFFKSFFLLNMSNFLERKSKSDADSIKEIALDSTFGFSFILFSFILPFLSYVLLFLDSPKPIFLLIFLSFQFGIIFYLRKRFVNANIDLIERYFENISRSKLKRNKILIRTFYLSVLPVWYIIIIILLVKYGRII